MAQLSSPARLAVRRLAPPFACLAWMKRTSDSSVRAAHGVPSEMTNAMELTPRTSAWYVSSAAFIRAGLEVAVARARQRRNMDGLSEVAAQ